MTLCQVIGVVAGLTIAVASAFSTEHPTIFYGAWHTWAQAHHSGDHHDPA